MALEGLKGGAQTEWMEELSPGKQRFAGRNRPRSNGLAGAGPCQGSAGDHVRCQADGLEWTGEAMGTHSWLRSLFPSLLRQPPAHTAEQFPKAFSLICDCFPNPEATRVASFSQPTNKPSTSRAELPKLSVSAHSPAHSGTYESNHTQSLPCGDGLRGMTELMQRPRNSFRAGATTCPLIAPEGE